MILASDVRCALIRTKANFKYQHSNFEAKLSGGTSNKHLTVQTCFKVHLLQRYTSSPPSEVTMLHRQNKQRGCDGQIANSVNISHGNNNFTWLAEAAVMVDCPTSDYRQDSMR